MQNLSHIWLNSVYSTKNFFYEKHQKTFLCTLNHNIPGYNKMPSAAKMVFTFYFLGARKHPLQIHAAKKPIKISKNQLPCSKLNSSWAQNKLKTPTKYSRTHWSDQKLANHLAILRILVSSESVHVTSHHTEQTYRFI